MKRSFPSSLIHLQTEHNVCLPPPSLLTMWVQINEGEEAFSLPTLPFPCLVAMSINTWTFSADFPRPPPTLCPLPSLIFPSIMYLHVETSEPSLTILSLIGGMDNLIFLSMRLNEFSPLYARYLLSNKLMLQGLNLQYYSIEHLKSEGGGEKEEIHGCYDMMKDVLLPALQFMNVECGGQGSVSVVKEKELFLSNTSSFPSLLHLSDKYKDFSKCDLSKIYSPHRNRTDMINDTRDILFSCS